jgi:hypothetical protein
MSPLFVISIVKDAGSVGYISIPPKIIQAVAPPVVLMVVGRAKNVV